MAHSRKKANRAARSLILPQSAEELARAIVTDAVLKKPGGWTYDPRLCQCLEFDSNTNPRLYVISVEKHELRLMKAPDEKIIRAWLEPRMELLSRPGYYIGCWCHKGTYFLDVSLLIQGWASARRMAKANHQRGIYHPRSGRTIFLQAY